MSSPRLLMFDTHCSLLSFMPVCYWPFFQYYRLNAGRGGVVLNTPSQHLTTELIPCFLSSLLFFIYHETGSHSLAQLWLGGHSAAQKGLELWPSCFSLSSSWDDNSVAFKPGYHLIVSFLIQSPWETVLLDWNTSCYLVKTSCWQNSSMAPSQAPFSFFHFLLVPCFHSCLQCPEISFTPLRYWQLSWVSSFLDGRAQWKGFFVSHPQGSISELVSLLMTPFP